MTWTSDVLKYSKKFLLGVLVITVLWFLKKFLGRLVFPKSSAKVEVPNFSINDTISFSPKLGEAIEVSSDMTADAVLSGKFGPAVVMVYAEWCLHCRNMTEAYSEAAKVASIPFVRIQGSTIPVSSAKYGVSGYPTVFGIASVGGGPRRFAGQRTAEALFQFATSLNPEAAKEAVSKETKAVVEIAPAVQISEAPLPSAYLPVETLE